jgi:SAM-dependent methyltransferase
MQHYKIKTVQGEIPVNVMAPHKFGGEYSRRKPLYIGAVWFASTLAMVTNLSQAIIRKIISRNNHRLGEILWEMGRDSNHVSSFLVDRFSKYNHQSKCGAAGWQSLDLFYNYYEKIKPKLNGDFEGWITRQWIEKCENRQAVTNRLKIVVDLLAKAFLEFNSESEIRILSIASGSAQAVIEAMKRCPGLNIKVFLIDFDAGAIEEAKRLAASAGLENRISFICDTTRALEKAGSEFKPHIIQMVGFLDYRPRSKAIQLINRIRLHLPEGGIFITCNIRKNREKIFLDWILLWPMIYRDEEEFAELLVNGGFHPGKVHIIYEPFKIHGIAVCRK